MYFWGKSLFLFLLCGLPLGCTQFGNPEKAPLGKETSSINSPEKAIDIITTKEEDVPVQPRPDTSIALSIYSFPWLNESTTGERFVDRFPPPAGANRIMALRPSFADWLRHLPLQKEGHQVRLYNGDLKGNQRAQAAVFQIDIGRADLQQCADAVMRLRAEYLYSQQAYDAIHFNYTSGDKVAFADWSRGKKPRVQGNRVVFSSGGQAPDYSYRNFRSYLRQIFSYAGTASLSKEMTTVPVPEMEIGDVFIQGGFPGHAVIVIDMAITENGQKYFMLAQSYMPAQEIHILRNPGDANLSPWYPLDFGDDLSTPEWTFKAGDLKRF